MWQKISERSGRRATKAHGDLTSATANNLDSGNTARITTEILKTDGWAVTMSYLPPSRVTAMSAKASTPCVTAGVPNPFISQSLAKPY